MWKVALVGAIALATIGTSFVAAQETRDGVAAQVEAPGGIVITQAHIARLKTALRLSPAQERHWPAVEAAFRGLSHEQTQEASGGIVQRLRTHVAAVTVNAASLHRLATAAAPLLKSLDEDQKREAMTFARAIGVGNLAAAF